MRVIVQPPPYEHVLEEAAIPLFGFVMPFEEGLVTVTVEVAAELISFTVAKDMLSA